MESAESCLVVSDLLHGSGSTRSHLCLSGAVLGQGALLPQEGSLATWGRGLSSGPGMDLGQSCCALAQARLWSLCCLVLLLLGSIRPDGWDGTWLGVRAMFSMVLLARIPDFLLHSPQTSGKIHPQPSLSLCFLENAARGAGAALPSLDTRLGL